MSTLQEISQTEDWAQDVMAQRVAEREMLRRICGFVPVEFEIWFLGSRWSWVKDKLGQLWWVHIASQAVIPGGRK